MALTIGKVAKAANVHVETLRYYERRGLVPKPPRSLSLYRNYPENTVRRVRFVRHAQAIGFSLREIRELLSLRAAPKARCADVKRRADSKLRDIEEKIRALQAMHRALRRLVSQCDGTLPASQCPILESLDEESLHDGKETIN
ncbi:MAG TPA: heavy metal-responsive transcriptional regulator [Candidatus Binataceae bacterium]